MWVAAFYLQQSNVQSIFRTPSEWWIIAFTGCLVVVGILQFCAMRSQEKWMRDNVGIAKQSADAARDTVRAMKRTAERELRARVFVVSAIRLGDARPGSFIVEVTIRNFGKVPAYNCTFAVDVLLRPVPLNEELVDPRKTGLDPNMVLPPGGEVTILRKLPDGAFGINHHQSVMMNSYAVYIHGKIEYRNGFKSDRFSQFLLKSSADDYALGRFSFCEQGNRAD